MADYFTRYKKRVLGKATTMKERDILDLIDGFNIYLNEAVSATEYMYTPVDVFPELKNCEKVLMSINDISENDKTAFDEKIILVNNDVNIDVGCYVFFDNSWWVIVFKEHRSIPTYKKFIIKACNQIIKYKLNGVIYEIPMTVQNMTLYSDGMYDSRYVSYGDIKCRLTFGSNPITRHIKVNDRFTISHNNSYRLVNMVDYEYNGHTFDDAGLISCILLQTQHQYKDDLVNNVAYNNFSDKVDEIFIGETTCYIGEQYIYEYISNEEITFELLNRKEGIYFTQEYNMCAIQIKNDLNLIGTELQLVAKKGEERFTKNIIVRGV